jgi:hypothetical protein
MQEGRQGKLLIPVEAVVPVPFKDPAYYRSIIFLADLGKNGLGKCNAAVGQYYNAQKTKPVFHITIVLLFTMN